MSRQISAAGLELIKSFEKLRLRPYNDGVGVMTIGWGHAIKKGERFTQITAQQAEDILRKDLTYAQVSVDSSVHVPLTDNEFAACVSLAFNIGGDEFAHSTLCRLLNQGNKAAAADAFKSWNKGTVNGKKVVLRGLVRRREAERTLFLKK